MAHRGGGAAVAGCRPRLRAGRGRLAREHRALDRPLGERPVRPPPRRAVPAGPRCGVRGRRPGPGPPARRPRRVRCAGRAAGGPPEACTACGRGRSLGGRRVRRPRDGRRPGAAPARVAGTGAVREDPAAARPPHRAVPRAGAPRPRRRRPPGGAGAASAVRRPCGVRAARRCRGRARVPGGHRLGGHGPRAPGDDPDEPRAHHRARRAGRGEGGIARRLGRTSGRTQR